MHRCWKSITELFPVWPHTLILHFVPNVFKDLKKLDTTGQGPFAIGSRTNLYSWVLWRLSCSSCDDVQDILLCNIVFIDHYFERFANYQQRSDAIHPLLQSIGRNDWPSEVKEFGVASSTSWSTVLSYTCSSFSSITHHNIQISCVCIMVFKCLSTDFHNYKN